MYVKKTSSKKKAYDYTNVKGKLFIIPYMPVKNKGI